MMRLPPGNTDPHNQSADCLHRRVSRFSATSCHENRETSSKSLCCVLRWRRCGDFRNDIFISYHCQKSQFGIGIHILFGAPLIVSSETITAHGRFGALDDLIIAPCLTERKLFLQNLSVLQVIYRCLRVPTQGPFQYRKQGPPAMPEALVLLRYFRESDYLLTVYQVSLPSTVEVVVQPAPRVILPVLALTGSTVVTPGL